MNDLEKSSTEPTPQLRVHRIYVKGCSFESAALSPALLDNPPEPVLDLKISSVNHTQDADKQEVVLILEITAKHNGSLLSRLQLQQAGVYLLKDFTEEQKKLILNGFCLTQLYSYACGEADRLVTQGGFLPFYLNPLNFEQLYLEEQKRSQTGVDIGKTEESELNAKDPDFISKLNSIQNKLQTH